MWGSMVWTMCNTTYILLAKLLVQEKVLSVTWLFPMEDIVFECILKCSLYISLPFSVDIDIFG